MVEREFDWPSLPPVGFWEAVGTHGIESRFGPPARASRGNGTGLWAVYLGHFGDEKAPVTKVGEFSEVEVYSVKLFAYGLLSDHFRGERNSQKAPQTCEQPPPPEREARQGEWVQCPVCLHSLQTGKLHACEGPPKGQVFRYGAPDREERPWKGCEYTLTASKLHDSLDWLADRQDLHGVAGIDLVGLVSDLRKRLERLEATND